MKYIIAFALCITLFGSTTCHGDQILSPTNILQNTAGVFTGGAEVENAFNGSGLTPGFTSGVTNFDAYIGSNPLHTTSFAGSEWFSANNGFVDLEFDSVYNFSRMAVWNEEGGNGVGSVTVFSSLDDTFTSLTLVGTYNPAQNPAGFDYPAEVFVLGTTAQYLRMDFVGNSGGVFGLGEIAFAGTAIPEPTCFALLGLGSLVLAGRRRRS